MAIKGPNGDKVEDGEADVDDDKGNQENSKCVRKKVNDQGDNTGKEEIA